MSLGNKQKLILDSCKMVEKQSEAFHTRLWYFLKQNIIAYRSSKVSSRADCIFYIYQLWQSGFYNSCCSCSFEPEIIKIGQLSHKMYRNNIVNFQESTTILNACTKKSGNLLNAPLIIINSIKHQSFAYTQLNDQRDLFQVVQFSIQYTVSMSKQFQISTPYKCQKQFYFKQFRLP